MLEASGWKLAVGSWLLLEAWGWLDPIVCMIGCGEYLFYFFEAPFPFDIFNCSFIQDGI